MPMMPARFRAFHRAYRSVSCTILDVGCGDHSPGLTKRYFPKCTYHGIDREAYNLDADDVASIDVLYKLDLERDGLEVVPDGAFDVVIASHILEHLRSPEPVLRSLCSKLKVGGTLYLEFPSLASLGLPAMDGTLQFSDDPTHVHLPDPYAVTNLLFAEGVAVVEARTRRDLVRVLAAPLFMLVNLGRRVMGRPRRSRGLWDVSGFAFYVLGVRRTPTASTQN